MRSTPVVDLEACREWYLRNRGRSRAWFDLISPDAYYARPIHLRHPVVFYDGHVSAFTVNTLLKRGLGEPGIVPEYERLFERGIDPPENRAAAPPDEIQWPERGSVEAYTGAADQAVLDVISSAAAIREDRPLLRDGLALYTILEHEAMHHETLLYMYQWLPHDQKRPPGGYRAETGSAAPHPGTVRVPAGIATIGAEPGSVPFAWDNEVLQKFDVPAFEIDVYNVTNEAFMRFVDAGGYADPQYWSAENWRWREQTGLQHPLFWCRRGGSWFWRGFFEEVALPGSWPVYVSHAEATAYLRWCGRRLPTEAEFHRAAYGTPEGVERAYPWGDASPEPMHGNLDFQAWDPMPVGSFPAGASAWGIMDLVGNGWEWTSTVFERPPGFEPNPVYPNYSADFFDGQHYVLKGASPATPRELTRRSWRNWFRARYPYAFATFRSVSL